MTETETRPSARSTPGMGYAICDAEGNVIGTFATPKEAADARRATPGARMAFRDGQWWAILD